MGWRKDKEKPACEAPNEKAVAHVAKTPSQGVQIMSKSLTNCQIKMVFVLQNTHRERGRRARTMVHTLHA